MEVDYMEYELSGKEKYGFLMGGYLSIFTVLYLFYHDLFFSLAGGLMIVCFTGRYKSWKAEKRRTLLITQFKDLLYSMTSYTAVNVQLSYALEGCLSNLLLLYDEDSPLINELNYMVRDIKENKANEVRLLKDFAERSHCEDIENFVQVYSACTITGGNLEKVLKNTIEILMDKITIEREIKTLTSQKRFEGNIITAMPLIVIMFLNVFSPDYLEPLYSDASGRLIMTGALTGLVAAHIMTRKITSIEV